jgi:hypothetical protein
MLSLQILVFKKYIVQNLIDFLQKHIFVLILFFNVIGIQLFENIL